MSKQVNGVVFDAVARKYREFNSSDADLLKDLREAIGCTMIETYQLSREVSVWFDEEFFLKQESWLEKHGRIPVTRLGTLDILGRMVFLGAVKDDGSMASLDLTAFNIVRQAFQYGTSDKKLAIPKATVTFRTEDRK